MTDKIDRRHFIKTGAMWGSEERRTRLVVIGRQGATHARTLEALLDTSARPVRPVVSITAEKGGGSG